MGGGACRQVGQVGERKEKEKRKEKWGNMWIILSLWRK